jgi:endogenous inhibitor of DNA gyrase (YacG/DUF329 family)
MQGTLEQRTEKLRELKTRKIELGKRMVEYRVGNLLEFFDKSPNPGPNPKQAQILEAFLDPSYLTFGMDGGNRLGKTFLLTTLGLSVVFGKYLWNNESLLHLFPHKYPRKVKYVGQGWHDHIQGVVIPQIRELWPAVRVKETHGNGIITDTFWKDVQTGGTIEIQSNNQDTKEHEGWKGDLILYDEPPRREIYVANARGLVDRKGREVFAATLLAEPWIDKDVKKKVGKDGKPEKSVFWVSGTSYDNVGYGITKEGVDQLSAKLTDNERQARIFGIPQYMQGLIYPQFSRKEHFFPWFPVPLTWMVDIAIDIHPRERQAVLFVATDPRNDRYICDEVWDYGDGTWVGEQIVKKVNNNSYRVNRIVIDPLSKGDANNAETTYQKVFNVLARYGFSLETASKDKDAGILEVKKHLRGPNNKPSIFLLDNCMRTLSEIEGYMWNKETNKPCVIGSTIIDTPSGQFQIKDLVGKELWVYTYSNEHGRLNVCKAKNIRKTRENAEIWRLSMDQGSLFATPDHLIMLRNGTYRALKDLKPYDSLMPLYRTVAVDGYPKINPNDHRSKKGGKYPGEHRFVWECIYGPVPDGKEIHHKDFNYLNHVPENLQPSESGEHQKIHIENGVATVPCLNCGESFLQKRSWQKHCSARCRQQHGDSRRGQTVAEIVLCPICQRPFMKDHARQIYCSVTCRDIFFREHRKSWSSYNHKVLSVSFYGHEDVYDMEVETDHNFVANGIVVHNCDKDDHMMENLYRICNLNTQFVDPEEEVHASYSRGASRDSGRNAMTGY